jgi:Uma2 family endonuclease
MPRATRTAGGSLHTWQDYFTWPDDERREIIGGVAHSLLPSSPIRHQIVVGNLANRLWEDLRGGACRPFIGPIDLKLSDLDVIQPDILVVCDAAKIMPTHIEGAPELVVEVLSPTTAAKDLREKKALYERTGVAEYLVVDPLENYAMRFLNGPEGFDKGRVFTTLDGLEVPLWGVFEVEGPGQAEEPGSQPE